VGFSAPWRNTILIRAGSKVRDRVTQSPTPEKGMLPETSVGRSLAISIVTLVLTGFFQIFSAVSVVAIGLVFIARNSPNNRTPELQSWGVERRSSNNQTDNSKAPTGQSN